MTCNSISVRPWYYSAS